MRTHSASAYRQVVVGGGVGAGFGRASRTQTKEGTFFFSSPRARARPDPLSSSRSLSLLFQSDVIDIVHVAKIMAPESTVFHGVPGTSYSFHDEPLKDVQSHLATVREWLAAEVVPVLTAAGARHEVHLFVEKTTAPAADVAATITCVADSVDAPLIVMVSPGEREREAGMVGVWGGWAWSPPPVHAALTSHLLLLPCFTQAKSNKTTLDKLFVGSVADKVAKSGRNVVLMQ